MPHPLLCCEIQQAREECLRLEQAPGRDGRVLPIATRTRFRVQGWYCSHWPHPMPSQLVGTVSSP